MKKNPTEFCWEGTLLAKRGSSDRQGALSRSGGDERASSFLLLTASSPPRITSCGRMPSRAARNSSLHLRRSAQSSRTSAAPPSRETGFS
ncbi:hypothetical protein SKAU_G00084810 [Synaphobranchus kaupii]|uniref:Uncharacterized protein n=1 Tax=Synaphobranchus kaupii TaxID=118154 RepID=A0A9Q1FVE5_SYNKA|nr:hypothetical protein SKAU_G00084810 [Synaphobranchus kaupii]